METEVMAVFREAVKQKNCCTGGLWVTVRSLFIHTGVGMRAVGVHSLRELTS